MKLRIALALCALTACSRPTESNKETSDALWNYAPGDDDFPDPPFPDPTLQAPLLPKVVGRTPTRIRVRWHDRTSLEHGHEVQRRMGTSGPFVVLQTHGPLPQGDYTFTDTNTTPGALHCYRIRTWNSPISLTSPVICAHARGTKRQQVVRAQLTLAVADIADAGTDDSVFVMLNDYDGAGRVPSGNRTYIDYSHDDFERNSQFSYDLVPPDDLHDITRLAIRKTGTDGLCIKSLELVLNANDQNPGQTVFAKDYSNTPVGCVWLDGGENDVIQLTIPKEELRAHSGWPSFGADWCGDTPASHCAAQMIPMTLSTLKDRMEGAVGHMLAALPIGRWHNHATRGGIVITEVDSRTLHIAVNVRGVKNNLPDADVTLSGDAVLSHAPADDDQGTIAQLGVDDFDAQVGADFGYEVFGALIGVIVDPALVHFCADFRNCLKNFIEGKIESKLNPISEAFDIPKINGACISLSFWDGWITASPVDCADIDGDFMPNAWELEHGFDPDYRDDAGGDADGDTVSNQREYELGTNPNCRVEKNHADYCRDCGPCGSGLGDCDPVGGQSVGGQCAGKRVCGDNNGADYGLSWEYDVCFCPLPEDHANYCRDCGPCPAGKGQCDPFDFRSQCVSGAICAFNNGADFGLPAHFDVCKCTLPKGHPDYCKECGPCPSGQGDCDGDYQCELGLHCVKDVGASYGFAATVDVCKCTDLDGCDIGTQPGTIDGF